MIKLTLIALTSIMMAGCYKQDMPSGNTQTSDYCGHPTQDGTPCKRKVAGGGYCGQHK